MLIPVNGLVIRETAYKENDKILTLLTPDRGKISVYCHGVRSIRSRNLVATQLFCWSEFILDDKKDMYTMREASLIENFYFIRENLDAFAFAQYALDAANEAATEENPEEQMTKLLLNTLYICQKKDICIPIVKAAFELRFSAVLGFCPDLTRCGVCGVNGTNEIGKMLFDIPNGRLLCASCASTASEGKLSEVEDLSGLFAISGSTLDAMRYIIGAPEKRIFSFSLGESAAFELETVCERFLLYNLGRSFESLNFYHSLSKI